VDLSSREPARFYGLDLGNPNTERLPNAGSKCRLRLYDRAMADPGFDPRFDPAFQPGFDPDRHASGTAVPVAPLTAAAPEVAVLEPPTAVADTAALSVSPAPVSRRNPLLIVLWVASAVLVAAGVYVLRLVADRVDALGTSGGFGAADYYLMQAYTALGPLLITLGIATAIGTVFMLAVRWNGKH
jgi:hypothetical protein